jgi:hypothetical protein
MWQSDRPLTGSVRVTDNGGRAVAVPAPDQAADHLFRLTGLQPGTTYHYQALEGGQVVGEGSFHTNRGPGDNHFRFAVLGDTGSGNANQYAIAKRIRDWQPEFVLHTGDVVYEKGLAQDYPARFFGPYHELMASTVMYLSPGNHDYGSGHAKAYLSAIDAPRANPNEPENWYTFTYGDAQFFALDSNRAFEVGSPQYKWLSSALAHSTAKWKIAYFHHPLYSSGWEGSSVYLRNVWGRLFERYDVQLVFNGHDHDYERITPREVFVRDGHPTQYIVTGGGGAWLRKVGHSSFTAVAQSVYHFMGVTMDGDTLSAEAIDKEGRVIDRWSIRR